MSSSSPTVFDGIRTLVDPPFHDEQLVVFDVLFALRRHVLVVVLGQFGAEDDVAVEGVARLDAVTFLAAFYEKIKGIHAELALGFLLLVALHAAEVQDGLDDVRVNDLLLQGFGGLFLRLFLRQAESFANGIGRILEKVVLAVGDGCTVMAGIGHDADAGEEQNPERCLCGEPGKASRRGRRR